MLLKEKVQMSGAKENTKVALDGKCVQTGYRNHRSILK